MKQITGLIGRDELVRQVIQELRKGKHVLLTGLVGIGKSAVLEAALETFRRGEKTHPSSPPLEGSSNPEENSSTRETQQGKARPLTVVYLRDHQAKGQFVEMARQLLEAGIVKPSTLDLAKRFDALPPAEIEWATIKRTVSRLSIRDLTGAIIPALHAYEGRVLIAVDDMTRLTPTQQAFWLAPFDQAQIVTCASEKKQGLRKLWWKMKEITVPPLAPEAAVYR